MDRNNKEELLSLIKNYNERLSENRNNKEQIRKDNEEKCKNNEKVIEVLNKLLNQKELTEEEKRIVLEKGYSDIEEIIQRVYTINKIQERGISLTEDQIKVLDRYSSILGEIQAEITNLEEENRRIKEEIDVKDERTLISEELIEKIEANNTIGIDTLSLLGNMILDGNSILSLQEKISLLERIIRYNDGFREIDSNQDINTEEDEVVNDRIRISEEDIRNLLAEYGYNFDDLDEENKKYLQRHGDLNKITLVLETLKENEIRIYIGNDYGDLDDRYKESINRDFCKVLVYSSPEIITTIKSDIAERLKNVTFEKFINDNIKLIIPNRKKRHNTPTNEISTGDRTGVESGEGGYNNYKENKEFFEEKKLDFNWIINHCPTILVAIPEYVRTNYEIYTTVYGIKFAEDTPDENGYYKPLNKLSALKANPNSYLLSFDRYIEVAPLGYTYIENNPTKAIDLNEDILYRLRVAVKEIAGLFYERGRHGLVIKDTEFKEWRRNHSIEKVKEKFDPNSKDENNQYIPRKMVEEEQAMIFRNLIDTTNPEVVLEDWESDTSLMSNPYIVYLESVCKLGDYVYGLDGTIISRKKVLRILGQLINRIGAESISEDMIIYAITYGSIINEKDETNIKNYIKEVQKGMNNNSLGGGQR